MQRNLGDRLDPADAVGRLLREAPRLALRGEQAGVLDRERDPLCGTLEQVDVRAAETARFARAHAEHARDSAADDHRNAEHRGDLPVAHLLERERAALLSDTS